MAQNNNIVVYAPWAAVGAPQPPAGHTYHLPPFTLVGEYSHRRPDRQSISAHKLALGIPHHPINKPPPEYLYWRDAVKDQMSARGSISDNWHFPDAEFVRIVEGMRRLKPARDELATASAANNMASMQVIDEAVLQMVKDCGKKLANTNRTNNHAPPPGPGTPPAQVIVRPMLLPLNAPPQCQWSIATPVVPNAGPVGQNAPLANAPGRAQNIPAPPVNPQAQIIAGLPNAIPVDQNAPLPNAPGPGQNVPAPPAGAQAVPAPLASRHAQQIAAPRGPGDPEAQNDPPAGPANPQCRIGLRLGNLYPQKNAHQTANIPGQIQSGPSIGILGTPLGIKHAPANPPGPINLPGPDPIPVQIQSGPSMGILGTPQGIKHAPANRPGSINLPCQEDIPVHIQADPQIGILGTPLGMKHAPANPQGPINLPGPEDIPVQIQADPPMGILRRPIGMRHAPPADIPEAAAPNAEDPLLQSLDVTWRVRRKLGSFLGNNPDVFFLNLLT